jgi:tetratricopeptide (TPR) repeat protein
MRLTLLACAALVALAGAARAENALSPSPSPSASAPAAANAALDDLFARLAVAEDDDEAAGVIAAIDRLHLQSGSDTGDLLMARAVATMDARDYPVALAVLDALVGLEPGWAEAWSRRAMARYLSGDSPGAMADLAQALARDPRHLQALVETATILEDEGLKQQALDVYRRALALAPRWRPVADGAAKLKADLAGQAL